MSQAGTPYQQHIPVPKLASGDSLTFPMSHAAQDIVPPNDDLIYPQASLRKLTDQLAAVGVNENDYAGTSGLESHHRPASSANSFIEYTPESKNQAVRSAGPKQSARTIHCPSGKFEADPETPVLCKTNIQATPEHYWSKNVRGTFDPPGYDHKMQSSQCPTTKNYLGSGTNVKAEQGQLAEKCYDTKSGSKNAYVKKVLQHQGVLSPSASHVSSYNMNDRGTTKYAESVSGCDGRGTNVFDDESCDPFGEREGDDKSGCKSFDDFGRCYFDEDMPTKSYNHGWGSVTPSKRPNSDGGVAQSRATDSVYRCSDWDHPKTPKMGSIYSRQESNPSMDAWLGPETPKASSEVANFRQQVAHLENSFYRLQDEVRNAKPSSSLSEVDFLRGLVTSGSANRETMHRMEVKHVAIAARGEVELPREIHLRGQHAGGPYAQGGEETLKFKW